MFFFAIHHFIQNIPVTKDWQESKKNIVTFLIGAISYVFLTSFLNSKQYKAFIDANFLTFTLKNWLLWIIGIDVFAMAIVYKCYWGRTILSELPETWGDSTVPLSEKSKTPERFEMQQHIATMAESSNDLEIDDLESKHSKVTDDPEVDNVDQDAAVIEDSSQTETQKYPHDEVPVEMEEDPETIHIKAN